MSRVRLERGEVFMVALFRSRHLPIDIFIDPENGDDKKGNGSAAKPFKSVKPLERLWPKKVLP